MRLKTAIATTLLIAFWGSVSVSRAQAQQMLLMTRRVAGSINDPITFDIVSDGDTGLAVAWGTTVALSDPIHMTYVPNYDGQGNPYRKLEKFFDTDISDVSQIGNGLINLDFVNTTPGATLGYNGLVYLSEFQVLLSSQTPLNTDLTVGLAPLGIPPYGTSMLDAQGNNILQPADPNHPNDNVSTAHLYVTGNGPNLRWQFGSPPSDVPEPSVWLTGMAGFAVGVSLLHRRRRAGLSFQRG